MRKIEIDGVTHEVSAETFETLFDNGALVGTELDTYVLNENHLFTAAEVRLLLNPEG